MKWAEISSRIALSAPDTALVLRNLRAPRCVVPQDVSQASGPDFALVDITLRGGGLTDIQTADPAQTGGMDMGCRIVWPLTVDCHTHIDKGQVWPRSPNPDGSFGGALTASGAEFTSHQSPYDIRGRADFALKAAHAHGTGLLRTHVDASPETFQTRFGVLREVAQDWAGRVDVQLCPFSGTLADPDWLAELGQAAKGPHSGTLSFFLQANPTLEAELTTVMQFAIDHDLALDFHADETLNPASNCLETVARVALHTRFEQPILVGHCCSLSVQDDATVARTLDLVAQTQIGIVALPLCNMYLQDRHAGTSPRQRGIAPMHEIAARGIPVAVASDNARDAFYAYGDLDVPDLFRDATRMMQLDHPVGDWPATVTSTAARLIGAPDKGRLHPGMPADMILFSARNWSELISRPAHDRIVLRAGLPTDTTPPDFTDLDTLEGMTP